MNNFTNSNNLLAVSDSQNDIEFAVAQITKHLEELNKAEALGKSLIVPHKHQGSMAAGAAVDDVPPSKVNPPGMDKEEKKMSTKCAKCGELWKDEAEKCFKCGHLEKCGEMTPPLKKASLVYAPGGPLEIQGMNPKAEMPPATGKDISEPFAAEGSGGQIKKGSVKSLRNKAAKMAKADVPMAKPPAPKAAPSAPAMSAKPSTMVKEEMAKAKIDEGKRETVKIADRAARNHGNIHANIKGVHQPRHDRPHSSKEYQGQSKLGDIAVNTNKDPEMRGSYVRGAAKEKFRNQVIQTMKEGAKIKPTLPGIFGRMENKKLNKTTLQEIEPDGSISKTKTVSKSDFWSPEVSADEKINPSKGGAKPKAAPAPTEAPKPKFTGADLAAAKAKMVAANVKPLRPGIFGKLAKRNKQ